MRRPSSERLLRATFFALAVVVTLMAAARFAPSHAAHHGLKPARSVSVERVSRLPSAPSVPGVAFGGPRLVVVGTLVATDDAAVPLLLDRSPFVPPRG